MGAIQSMADVPRERFVQWAVVLPIAALVGLAVGVVMWPQAQASETAPSPTASSAPSVAAALPPDSRYPQAPELNATSWKQVDASWDLEVVAYAGGGSITHPEGSLAAYLSPPGGERHLAFYREGVDPPDLTALGWDPKSMLLLLGSKMTRTFAVADLHSGALTPLDPPGLNPEAIKEIQGLGRGSDGRIYVTMVAKDPGGGTTLHLTSWAADGWAPVTHTDFDGMSRLSGDTSVAITEDGVVSLDVVSGIESDRFANASECEFVTWSTAADFVVGCDIERDDSGGIAAVGGYKSGNVRTRAAMVDLGANPLPQFPYTDAYAAIAIGTPLVFTDDSADGKPGEVGIATADGFRPLGSPQVEAYNSQLALAADSRWIIVDESHVPIVIDAARGTLTDLRQDFQGTNLAFTFLPGERS